MKISGTVILYNPTEIALKNIQTYLHAIDKLYIFDNSIEKSILIPPEILIKSNYYHDGENQGIAKRLNQAINYSKNDGFDFLLTMDQDSSFSEIHLMNYLDFIKNENKKNTISMFGVRYYENKKENNKKETYNEILITSGSIVNVKTAVKIKGFDENLFIDGVDTEYCLNSFRNGFKTKCYNTVFLNHTLGEENRIKNLLGKYITRVTHSPIRIYYIIRNHLYLIKKYPDFRFHIKNNLLINEIKNGILYSGKPLTCTLAIILALIHSKINTMGKLKNKYEIKLMS